MANSYKRYDISTLEKLKSNLEIYIANATKPKVIKQLKNDLNAVKKEIDKRNLIGE